MSPRPTRLRVLAYGDLKRVELAMALANQPRLLLMDEPTAGMAPKERVELMGLTARTCPGAAVAVLFTEHDMDVVFSQADRIIVLDRGRIIAGGLPAEVRAKPDVQAVYLGGGIDLRYSYEPRASCAPLVILSEQRLPPKPLPP